jgi:RNA polymerase sigma-70 factor (ECF subfamily)
MSQVDDQELVLQLQGGSLDALGELYDRHRQMVFRTALAITGDQDAACDLLQDVFLRLFRFAEHIDSNRPLEPWLYRMTTNLTYTWVKRNNRWMHSLEDVADLSLGEISDILEVPEGTIKSRLYYGRLALKKSLELALYGEGEKLPELNYERP